MPPLHPLWLLQLLAPLFGGVGRQATTAAADSAGGHAALHPNNTGRKNNTTHAHTHAHPRSLSQSQCISLVFLFGARSMLMQSRSSYLPLCPADGRVRSTRRRRWQRRRRRTERGKKKKEREELCQTLRHPKKAVEFYVHLRRENKKRATHG